MKNTTRLRLTSTSRKAICGLAVVSAVSLARADVIYAVRVNALDGAGEKNDTANYNFSNTSGEWRTQANNTPYDGTPPVILCDLGAVQTIKGIKLDKHTAAGSNVKAMTLDFYDSPALSGTPVHTQTFTNISQSGGTLTLTTPTNARFVKFTMTANYGGDRYGVGNIMFDVSSTVTPASGTCNVANLTGYKVDNLFDKSSSTTWCSSAGDTTSGYYNGTNPDPVFTFELGTAKKLTGITVQAYNVTGNSIRNFNLEFLDASGNTIAVEDASKYSFKMWDASNGVQNYFSFPEVDGVKQVKMTVTSNFKGVASGGDRIGLAEVYFNMIDTAVATTPVKYNEPMHADNIVRPTSASFVTGGAVRGSARALTYLFDGTGTRLGDVWYTNGCGDDYLNQGYSSVIDFNMPSSSAKYDSVSIGGYGSQGSQMTDFILELFDSSGRLVFADEFKTTQPMSASQYATFSLGGNYSFSKARMTILDNAYRWYGSSGGDRVGFAEIFFSGNPPPAVTGVEAEQTAVGEAKVRLSFDVTNSPAAACPDWNRPYLSIVATDNETGANYAADISALSARAPYQLADALAGSNGRHEVEWNMAGVLPDGFCSTNVTFTVAYLKMPDYCVIDLSGGTNAESFAVSYLDAEPEGGFTNDLYRTDRLAMRLIAPGTFKMGGETDTEISNAFYCAVFETTQKQWELVTGDNPSEYRGATRPVVMVSWNAIRGDADIYNWPANTAVDTNSFVGVLRLKTGLLSLDLPTEAQWEYACRAGTTTKYSWGNSDDFDVVCNYMWYNGNSTNLTHVVGTKRPNDWGLYDMHGNVWERCLDRWSSWPYRAVRGGGWSTEAGYCTSSLSAGSDQSSESYSLGFRLVRTLSDNPEGERAGEAFDGLPQAGTVCADSATGEIVMLVPFADGDITLTNCVAVYNGQPHTIGVSTNVIAGLRLKYASGALGESALPGDTQWSDVLPEFTDATNVTVFVAASARGYFTTTNSATVTITPKPVTVTAQSDAFIYDGLTHSNALYEVEGLVGADAMSAVVAGAITFPRESPVTNVVASYAFTSGSAGNYAVTVVNGALTITKAANAWIAAPSMAGWTAGATPATPNRGQAKFGTATVTYGVAGGAAGGLGAARPSAAGSYVATFTVPETENYDGLVRNMAFTVKAKSAPKTYTVKFAANGGTLLKGKSMAAQKMTLDKAAALRGNVFTRGGYVFVGWAKTPKGAVAIRNGQSVKNIGKAGQTVTLYAVWAKAQYKVVFDASGGRGKMPVQVCTYGKPQKLVGNRFTRKGYVFGGWAIRDPLATVPKVAYKDKQAVKNLSSNGATVKLYAVWKRKR